MTIQALRILPPLAIARLGSASQPLDNFVTEIDPQDPLGFRRIVPAETLVVDDKTGEIGKSFIPASIAFKDDGKIRPVAPFLEVFAQTSADTFEPLTVELLERAGLSPKSIRWSVSVANRKVARRTGDARDVVDATTGWFSNHDSHGLEGHCENFVSTSAAIRFGAVRYINPTEAFPQIRLRFTPAQGLIYGSNKVDPKVPDEDRILGDRRVYDTNKGSWYRFEVPHQIDEGGGGRTEGDRFWNETLPPSLFAIVPPAPSWLYGNIAISRGYLDDACDGIVEVELVTKGGQRLKAAARVTSGPPMLVPDARFVRSLADDLEQVVSGPTVPSDEPLEVTQARAEEIVRRAYETVRFLNVAVMNGDPINGRSPLDFDTMPAEEAFDTNRLMRPVMAEGSVDTLSVMALHQQVFAALRGGAAPWFLRLLRRPEEVVDFTDEGRRKMPALMCGADGSYLALTHLQISTIERVTETAPFQAPLDPAPEPAPLTPRNLTAQLEYVAAGNPASSRPSSAIANCTPGLEVDFRAVWRRIFKGIELREYDNLVVGVDEGVSDVIRGVLGHRLLRVNRVHTMGTMVGPSPADPAQPVVLATEDNPHALAPLEWSNALAAVLASSAGGKVTCDFSKEESWYEQQPWTGREEDCISIDLEVRRFFEPDTAFISSELALPGELTQGLCSPWQNDFRECSCYYWASSRPDFVNVEQTQAGGSTGDNWLQKERTGAYVPDDYVDERLVDYDELFVAWEHWLRFQVGGRDAPAEPGGQ
jgi:hypothetical protein